MVDSFPRNNILCWHLWSFRIWNSLFKDFMAFKVCTEKSAVTMISFYFVCDLQSFLAYFINFSFCILSVLSIVGCGEAIFCSSLFGVCVPLVSVWVCLSLIFFYDFFNWIVTIIVYSAVRLGFMVLTTLAWYTKRTSQNWTGDQI